MYKIQRIDPQTDPNVYLQIEKNYIEFLKHVNNKDVPPVPVFYPLSKRSLDELAIIREVSASLQQKKEEDMRKAAAAAEEQEKQKAEEQKKDGETADEETKKEEESAEQKEDDKEEKKD